MDWEFTLNDTMLKILRDIQMNYDIPERTTGEKVLPEGTRKSTSLYSSRCLDASIEEQIADAVSHLLWLNALHWWLRSRCYTRDS